MFVSNPRVLLAYSRTVCAAFSHYEACMRISKMPIISTVSEFKVNAEVSYLRQTLPPAKTAAFEVFMVQFLSHTTAGSPPSLVTGKTAPTAVTR